MKFVVLKRENYPMLPLEDLMALLYEGGQISVKEEILQKNILSSELIGLCLEDNLLVGAAAIKNPQKSYIKKVFEESGNAQLLPKFHYEVGYCVTHEDYRGHGICNMLVQELMGYMPDTNLWATTRTNSMKRLFLREGFKSHGFYKDLELFLYAR